MSLSIRLKTPPSPLRTKPVPREMFLKRRLGTPKLEALCDLPPVFAEAFCHPVVEAALFSFAEHLPLALRPDDFWLMISQGFAKHITMNAEELRGKFVAHEGQLTLIVIRNGFQRGSAENDWPGVFTEFSVQIGEHIGETQKTFVPAFSTTTPMDTAAFEVVLMDAMSPYFRYEVHTLCGIPSILLEGEKADWERVLEHTRKLAAIDPSLSWWTDRVLQRLEEIVNCFDSPNDRMWESFFKEHNGSGGSTISGWIVDFFPYIETYDKKTIKNSFRGLKLSAFPSGLSSVPFLWKYLDTDLPMKFFAGHMGAAHVDGHMRPIIGWAVRDSELPKNEWGEDE